MGEDSNTTFVDASWVGDAIYVSADWVNITGFNVSHGGVNPLDGGIQLDSVGHCTVTGNIAYQNARGFILSYTNKSTLHGNTAIKNWDYGIYVTDSTNNTIRDNKLVDNYHSGIYVMVSNDNTITHNILRENYYGIYVGYSRNITINLNELVGNDDYGISVSYSTEILVKDNNASDNWAGIRSWSSTDSTILNNTLVGSWYYGITLRSSSNITVTGNNASNNRDGASIYSSSGSLFIGNTFSSNSRFGIHTQISSNITFVGNNILYNDWGALAEGCLNLTFTANAFHNDGIFLMGNDLFNFSSHTITTDNLVNNLPLYYHKNRNDFIVDNIPTGQLIVANCANVTVKNLTIAHTDAGIEMAFVENASISYSNFSSNEQGGIYVYASSNVTVRESNFSSNKDGVRITISNTTIRDSNFAYNKYAIHIVSRNVTIRGNSISENDCGIRVHNSTTLEISRNNIHLNNNIGIRLIGVLDAHVHHNNIAENPEQAVDDGGAENSWDNGYPSGGNYWSDYIGVDNCSGPNQDVCPDPDGIGDAPYVIDANSQDDYPLMSSVGAIYPRPPSISGAILSGGNLENVTLTWSLSPDDGAGSESVVGYRIYGDITYSPIGLGYELLALVPNGTSEFVDNHTGEAIYYRVCAVDSYSRPACAVNQGGKFTRPLSQGPNLVSAPLIQSNESIETVLQTVECDMAWFYDSFSQEWKWHMTSKGYRRGLWSMNHTMGLWINVTEESNLTVAGIVPADTGIRLYNGWNLVGFPSFNFTHSVSDVKAETGATRVEAYDPLPPHHLRALGDAEVLQAGSAYWLRVEADIMWIVRVS